MDSRSVLDFSELKLEMLEAAGWICEVCGDPVLAPGKQAQLAHRIAQTKANISRFGLAVIHHRRNMAVTCSLKCNAACNIGGDPEAAKALAESIRLEVDN